MRLFPLVLPCLLIAVFMSAQSVVAQGPDNEAWSNIEKDDGTATRPASCVALSDESRVFSDAAGTVEDAVRFQRPRGANLSALIIARVGDGDLLLANFINGRGFEIGQRYIYESEWRCWNVEHSICSTIDAGGRVPEGFGTPYSHFTDHLLVQGSCTSDRATLVAGTGAQNQYVYNSGYYHDGEKWQQASLSGDESSGDWFKGQAQMSIPLSGFEEGDTVHAVAYVCQYIDGEWMCGCRDATCAEGMWQLQSFEVPEIRSDADWTTTTAADGTCESLTDDQKIAYGFSTTTIGGLDTMRCESFQNYDVFLEVYDARSNLALLRVNRSEASVISITGSWLMRYAQERNSHFHNVDVWEDKKVFWRLHDGAATGIIIPMTAQGGSGPGHTVEWYVAVSALQEEPCYVGSTATIDEAKELLQTASCTAMLTTRQINL